eukprot:5091918-Ditylum_brightwellii.AAC.1
MSSEVNGESVWGLTSLCSERLVTELGDKTMPPMTKQSLSILMHKIEMCRSGCCEDLDKCIQYMLPKRRQLLSMFRTTQIAAADYDVKN